MLLSLRNVNLDIKFKFYKLFFLFTLLFTAEFLSLTERDETRLDAFDMRCQRKILQIFAVTVYHRKIRALPE